MTADPRGAAKISEARDLFLSFGSTPALRGASLGVQQGEIVAVMGPSGSGKSTLLHCLAGILVPEQGEVWFGGQRLDTPSDDRRSALRSTPADQLAGRYPGRLAGMIGDAALSSPDSLVIIIGHTPAQLAGTQGSVQVTSIATTVPGRFDAQVNPPPGPSPGR